MELSVERTTERLRAEKTFFILPMKTDSQISLSNSICPFVSVHFSLSFSFQECVSLSLSFERSSSVPFFNLGLLRQNCTLPKFSTIDNKSVLSHRLPFVACLLFPFYLCFCPIISSCSCCLSLSFFSFLTDHIVTQSLTLREKIQSGEVKGLTCAPFSHNLSFLLFKFFVLFLPHDFAPRIHFDVLIYIFKNWERERRE